MIEEFGTCTICGADIERQQKVHRYEGFNCPTCNQRYDYDEGHAIFLDREQLAALRALWNDKTPRGI